MMGSQIVLEPDRLSELLTSTVTVASPDEERACDHIGRALARESMQAGMPPAQVFRTRFAGRRVTVTEVPADDGDVFVQITLGDEVVAS